MEVPRQRVDMRMDPVLLAWADARARELGVTRTELFERGLRLMREVELGLATADGERVG